MAVLQEQTSKSVNPFMEQIKEDLAPAGTWVATIIDIRDQFGVVRPTYDNPSVTEVVDLTTFLFGFRDLNGQPHKIASKTMRISGHEKSSLFGFLMSALGTAPKYGWDYCEMKGRKCLITVAHEAKRSGQGVYPTIATLCPVPAGMVVPGGGVPPAGVTQAPPVQAAPVQAAPVQAAPVQAAPVQVAPVKAAPAPAPMTYAQVADDPLPF